MLLRYLAALRRRLQLAAPGDPPEAPQYEETEPEPDDLNPERADDEGELSWNAVARVGEEEQEVRRRSLRVAETAAVS